MKPGIYLDKMLPQDFEAFFTLTGKKQVMELITGRALTREESLAKFNSLLKNNRLHESLGSFIVMDGTDSTMLGFAKLEITEEDRNNAELGFMLLPEFWGRGYGREIAEQLMGIAESHPGLNRVYANIDPDNMASRKILLRMGFVSEELGVIDGLPSEIFGRKLK